MSVNLRKHNSSNEKRPMSSPIAPKAETAVSRTKSMYTARQGPVRKRTESFGAAHVEEMVQCGICMERLTQPKMLPCQHTFCLSCLQTYSLNKNINGDTNASIGDVRNTLNKSKFRLECPTCKKDIVVENGIVGLESLPSNLYLDSLLNALNSDMQAKSANNLDNRCVKCQTVCQYTDQLCKHCKLNFCQVCWIEHAEEIEGKIGDFVKQLKDSKDRVECKHQDYQMQCELLKESVKAATEQRVAKIKAMETSIMEEIKEMYEDGSDSKDAFGKRIGLLIKRIDEVTSRPPVDHVEKIASYMEFHKETSKLLNDISQFGEIKKLFDADHFTLESAECCKLNLSEDVVDCGNNGNNLINNYKNRNFISKLIWNKCPKSAGVVVPAWAPELVYVAATDSKMVLILNRNKNKIVGKLTHENMSCPQSVACCNYKQEIFVSDKWNHCIHVFSIDGDYLRKLASRGTNEGQLLSPQGIAINNSGEILICDSGNNRILVLDPTNGKQINTIGLHGNKSDLKTPTDVKIFGDNIYVADSGNFRIKIYNKFFERIKEFGSMGTGKGQFRYAEVLAIDPCGFIVVGDAGNSRIQIFDNNGELVKVFGGVNSKRFRWVSGIHIADDFDIIVTDHKNKCLFIY